MIQCRAGQDRTAQGAAELHIICPATRLGITDQMIVPLDSKHRARDQICTLFIVFGKPTIPRLLLLGFFETPPVNKSVRRLGNLKISSRVSKYDQTLCYCIVLYCIVWHYCCSVPPSSKPKPKPYGGCLEAVPEQTCPFVCGGGHANKTSVSSCSAKIRLHSPPPTALVCTWRGW